MSSASGGYLTPTTTPLPGGLTLNRYIHNVLVGITGIANDMVRPLWQDRPPNQPDVTVNWMAFGVNVQNATPNSWVDVDEDGEAASSQRQVQLEISCMFYGPLALDLAQRLQDGLQIQQNCDALTAANMGFVGTGPINSVPDLINQRWVNRLTMSVFINWQIDRSYEILSILKAEGEVHTELEEEYSIPFETPDPPDDD